MKRIVNERTKGKKTIGEKISSNESILTLIRELCRTKHPLKEWKIYKNNMDLYESLNADPSFSVMKKHIWPCLRDRLESSAPIGSYFWQDLWAAKKIFEAAPKEHYDIGSRVDGFIAHLASFRDGIKCIDIRPMKSCIDGVQFIQADATSLQGISDDSVESISALCSLEHFGLGRYGDKVDPDAFNKAARSIVRVLKRGGYAYIAVPIGKQHLEFDAHRIFYASTVIEAFAPLELVEFSIGRNGENGFEKNADIHKYDADMDNHGFVFGLFHFKK